MKRMKRSTRNIVRGIQVGRRYKLMASDKELQAIAKELREINRRLDRLCRASIFSIDKPVVVLKSEAIEDDSNANKD
jgi:hypothetical protein